MKVNIQNRLRYFENNLWFLDYRNSKLLAEVEKRKQAGGKNTRAIWRQIQFEIL